MAGGVEADFVEVATLCVGDCDFADELEAGGGGVVAGEGEVAGEFPFICRERVGGGVAID